MSTVQKQANALDTIDAILQSIDSQVKQAESHTEAGGYQGETTHPVKNVEDSTQEGETGARASENEADIKEDQGEPGVDGKPDVKAGADKSALSLPANQDDVTMHIGMETGPKATGEDSKNETDRAKDKKDEPGGHRGETSHPANMDNSEINTGSKYAHSLSGMIQDLNTKIARTAELGNACLAKISVQAEGDVKQKAASLQSGKEKQAADCGACNCDPCECEKDASARPESDFNFNLPDYKTANEVVNSIHDRAYFGLSEQLGVSLATEKEAADYRQLGLDLFALPEEQTKSASAEPDNFFEYCRQAAQYLGSSYEEAVAPGFAKAAAEDKTAELEQPLPNGLDDAAYNAAYDLAQDPLHYWSAVVKRAENEYYMREHIKSAGEKIPEGALGTAEWVQKYADAQGQIDESDAQAMGAQVVGDIAGTIKTAYHMAIKAADFVRGVYAELTKEAMPGEEGAPGQLPPEAEPEGGDEGPPPEQGGGEGGEGGGGEEEALLAMLAGEGGGDPLGGGGAEMGGGPPMGLGGDMGGGLGGDPMGGGLGGPEGGAPGGEELGPEELQMLMAALQEAGVSPEELEAGAMAKGAAAVKRAAVSGKQVPVDWRPKTAAQAQRYQQMVNYIKDTTKR